jgi:hypothetical protein
MKKIFTSLFLAAVCMGCSDILEEKTQIAVLRKFL